MSELTQKNVMDVLVGTNIAGTAIASITNDLANLAVGQVIAVGLGTAGEVVLPVGGTPTNYPSIRLVRRFDSSTLVYSPRIFAKDVVSYTGIDGTAGTTEQVTVVGYNGTTGSIDTSGVDYTLTYVGDWDDMFWSEQKYRKAYNLYTTAPTQQFLAKGFTFLVNDDMFKMTLAGTGAQIKAEMLCDGTAASPGTAATAAVVNGSDIVTLNAADAGIQTIGTILRLGTAAGGRGTSVPVYVVIATPTTDSTLTSAQVRVHTYFQGTTDAALDLTADAGVVATATNYGMKFTGLPLTWKKDFFKFKKVRFHFDLKGFGATTVSTPTLASKGQGDYREVAEMESFAQGSEGALNRTVVPLPTGTAATVTDGSVAAYDCVAIQSADTSRAKSPITATAGMLIETRVFIPDGAANMTKLLTQLNPWMAAVGFPNVSV